MIDNERIFRAAAMDRVTRIVTVSTVTFLLGLPVLLFAVQADPFLLLFAVVATPLTVFVLWAMSPLAFAVKGDRLTVHRRLWRPFTVQMVALSTHTVPARLGIRLSASGGMFGWWGTFRRHDIGSYRVFLTTRDENALVPLRTTDGVVVISPDDKASFLDLIPTEKVS